MSATRARPGRQRVEDAVALRAADLVRGSGYGPRPDGTAPVCGRDGRSIGSVMWSTELFEGWGRVTVERRRAGEAWTWATDHIELHAVAHSFGPRWRFMCPRSGRLVPALYMPLGASSFACRQAHGLVHASTRISPQRRAEVRARKARIALGGSGDLVEAVPIRPKGMWAARYARLAAAAAPLSNAVGPL